MPYAWEMYYYTTRTKLNRPFAQIVKLAIYENLS